MVRCTSSLSHLLCLPLNIVFPLDDNSIPENEQLAYVISTLYGSTYVPIPNSYNLVLHTFVYTIVSKVILCCSISVLHIYIYIPINTL